MASDVSGIKGEYRRLTPSEIAVIVKTVRKMQGVKQAGLAAAAGVVERTLERLEAAKTVGEETYRRVAVALGLDSTLFTTECYVPTPEEAVTMAARSREDIERNHTRVPVERANDPRQIRTLFGRHGLMFDDSRVKAEHLELVADAKQMISDWSDIAADISEPERLHAAKEILAALREIENLGYVVKIGAADRYPARGKAPWELGVVVVFPRPITPRDSLPDEVLLRNDLRMNLG